VEHGLYVHIPFCNSKCNYCDFLSFAGQSNAIKHRYASALCRELKTLKEQLPHWKVDTIYIGGGTPSSLTQEDLQIVLEGVSLWQGSEVEYTVEINPESLDDAKANLLASYGVNRVSMGLQSAEEELLALLGRKHTAQNCESAVAKLRDAGIENINLDLMYGLPKQTLAQWEHTLQTAIALKPKHISMYQLKIEEGTPFSHWQDNHTLPTIDEDIPADQYLLGQQLLTQAGFVQYELSNYAQAGFESKHNLLYWQSKAYAAAGLGATAFYDGVRRINENRLYPYLQTVEQGNLSVAEEIDLSREEQMSEFVFMGLRLTQGVSKQEFETRFGCSLTECYAGAIATSKQRGLLSETAETIALTSRGRMLGDLVFMEFID